MKKYMRRNLLTTVLIVALLSCLCPVASFATTELDGFSVAINPERDYLIVVNDNHPYDFNGKYNQLLKQDLVYASDVYGEATALEKAAYLAFSQFQVAMREKGLEIGFYSGYRTEAEQAWVYDHYGSLEGWRETNTVRKPGFSEHHTGLMVNLLIYYPGIEENGDVWMTETAERQAKMPELKVLHETLADYGFIDRYPAGKEAITGVLNEPYEIRFVGSTKIAHEIMDNHLTLEEYLGLVK